MTIPGTMRCIVCTGSSLIREREVFDDRYGEPNLYRLVRCQGCGHLMTAPRLTEADLPALYGTYYPRKKITASDVARDAEQMKLPFAAFRRWLSGTDNQGQYQARAGENVLDVGCGNGLSLLEAEALGARAFGIEADPNVRPIADALNLRIHFGNLHDEPFPGERFDLIIMNQVIEHVPEPDEALEIMRRRLAPGGRIVLVFPNQESLGRRLTGARWIHWHIPFHLHHFDRKAMKQLAERCGLQFVRTRTITPNIWTLLQIRALGQTPKRGAPNPIWAVSTAGEATVTAASNRKKLRRFVVGASLAGIAALNRSIDFLGAGESLLVELRERPTS